MDMESNGKGTHVDGSPVQVATAPVLWGGLGIDGQHAYFQLIHQGKHLVPMDFIGLRTERSPLPFAAEHHRVVLLNMQAQAQALAIGRTPEETMRELRDSGLDEAEVQRLAPHRSYPGNVPSTTIWVDALTPRSMGALMALYEHKVFCQAAIWGIHAYDQWGVELGKKMAKDIEAAEAEQADACLSLDPNFNISVSAMLGDIGGTNARFGWQAQKIHPSSMTCAEKSLLAAAQTYLPKHC